jgi:hypothetical protein
MKPIALPLFLVVALVPTGAAAQVENMGPKAATYITDADVKKVNALPGVDRQIVSVHRGTTRKPAATPPTGANASTPAPNAPPAPVPCGEQMASLPAAVAGTGISHDHQTETYIITSGSGTLITGGRVLNGRKSAPGSPVTTTLNGPSCSGTIGGADVVSRVVNVGDIIIIPAGVPHGWSDIPDHVDYLSVRPDPDRVLKPYVHPVLQKK